MDAKPRGLHGEINKLMGLPRNRYLTRENNYDKTGSAVICSI